MAEWRDTIGRTPEPLDLVASDADRRIRERRAGGSEPWPTTFDKTARRYPERADGLSAIRLAEPEPLLDRTPRASNASRR